MKKRDMKKTTPLSHQDVAIITNSLVVACSSCGNPDFGQYAPLSVPKHHVCDTLEQASEFCMGYIEDFDLGGGNWTGGQVYHPTKGLIAVVSYNGRVWQPGPWTKDTKEFTGDELRYDHTKL